jgi:3-phosphoshikimate 1-carboxyvinyltransferase
MGARVDGRDSGRYPPLVIRGGELRGIDVRPKVPSAQVKSAILLAGLNACGETTVREAVATRSHTEELLTLCGADISVQPGAVTVRQSTLHPFTLDVPGDPSQAAFWLVAACITPGSDLVVEHVYVGPGRAGFLDVLGRMGALVDVQAADDETHTATLRARYGPLHATEVGGSEIPGLIDEIPVLAVAAAAAEGTTVFRDAAELRVKESDRVETIAEGIGALGVAVDRHPDGLSVTGRGGSRLQGGAVDSHGDHRIAMAMAVAALVADGGTPIAGWESVATSYPSFEEDLHRCVS